MATKLNMRGMEAQKYRRKVYPAGKAGSARILFDTESVRGSGRAPLPPFKVSTVAEATYQVEFSSDRMLVCWSLRTAPSIVEAMRAVRDAHGPSTLIHRVRTVEL